MKYDIINVLIFIALVIIIYLLFFYNKTNYDEQFEENIPITAPDEAVMNMTSYNAVTAMVPYINTGNFSIGSTNINPDGSIKIGSNTLINSDGFVKIGSTSINQYGNMLINGNSIKQMIQQQLQLNIANQINTQTNQGTNNVDLSSLPVTDSLMAFYDSRSVQNNIFKDLFGTYDATIVGTLPTVSNDVIEGTSGTIIYFPNEILPKGYTLFTIAKYNGPTRGRIITATNALFWFSGFFGGQAGVTHHGAWITENTSVDSNNWTLSVDQKRLYRANKIDYTKNNLPTNLIDDPALAINPTSPISDPSDFALKCVIVYNKELSTDDIIKVETWMSSTYGLM